MIDRPSGAPVEAKERTMARRLGDGVFDAMELLTG